jgi:hypothetical protein
VKLRRLAHGLWTVWGICNARGDDPIERLGVDVDRAIGLLDHVARNGPGVLPDNRNHAICENPKIIQLSAGRARLAYFFDGQRLIVICHAFAKSGGKSGKTNQSDIQVAATARAAYYQAKATNTLEYDNGE